MFSILEGTNMEKTIAVLTLRLPSLSELSTKLYTILFLTNIYWQLMGSGDVKSGCVMMQQTQRSLRQRHGSSDLLGVSKSPK